MTRKKDIIYTPEEVEEIDTLQQKICRHLGKAAKNIERMAELGYTIDDDTVEVIESWIDDYGP